MDLAGDQIEATFFKEAVDKFYGILEQGKIYLFANGAVKLANKKFTSIKNDYCLTFG